VINKNIHSYPLLDISTYFDDFINQRKLFLKETRHLIDYDINNIRNEVNKVIDSYISLNQSSSSLINRLNRIIVKFESLDESDTELIMYLKRYFELHRVLYAEYNSKKKKLTSTSQINDINILFAVSYLLQLMHIKTNDFNYLSTSVKINEFILNDFTLDELKNYPLINYLINHELLILRNYDENI
tara:strand:+ start:1031 stop:1588 length:558 start_codon:yes stop_codon:yes gene_type:complete